MTHGEKANNSGVAGGSYRKGHVVKGFVWHTKKFGLVLVTHGDC